MFRRPHIVYHHCGKENLYRIFGSILAPSSFLVILMLLVQLTKMGPYNFSHTLIFRTRLHYPNFCAKICIIIFALYEKPVSLLSNKLMTFHVLGLRLIFLLSPPGLCALSINHSNSYLSYPGSATIGEIIVYDVNSLVRECVNTIMELFDCFKVSIFLKDPVICGLPVVNIRIITVNL